MELLSYGNIKMYDYIFPDHQVPESFNFIIYFPPGIAQSVKRRATGWTAGFDSRQGQEFVFSP
jgi:hypothetical protein